MTNKMLLLQAWLLCLKSRQPALHTSPLSAVSAQPELSISPPNQTLLPNVMPFILSVFAVHSRSWNINSPRHTAERSDNSTSTEDFMIHWGSLRVCSLPASLSLISFLPAWGRRLVCFTDFLNDNSESHKVSLAAKCPSIMRRSDVLCSNAWSFSQNWAQQLSGNGASTGATERFKLNLCVNAGAHHCVTQTEERQWLDGGGVTVCWQTATVAFPAVGSLPGSCDGCFLFCLCSFPPDEIVTQIILSWSRHSVLTVECTMSLFYSYSRF